MATAVLPTAVGPKIAIVSTRRRSADAGEQLLGAEQRLRGRLGDLHEHELAGRARPLEVDGLVVAAAAAQARGVGPARPLDQDLHIAADEALGALSGTALNRLDELLHPLLLDRM